MKSTRSSGARRPWAFVALALMASCGAPPGATLERPGGVVVETVFLDGDHRAERCLKELSKSLLDLPDGVLFFDRDDSRIRVTPPRGPRIESYHVHLFHRVGGDVLDHVVRQNDAGLIELNLSRFDQPEEIVVVSSSYRFSKREAPPRQEEALTPPYAMAFRLVPMAESEAVMSLQSFRYEVETNLGNLALFVQSFNRRDMLITWVDPGKKLGALIQDDPYIHLKKEDGYIPPRVIVDVLRTKGEMPWQRAGTWHLPASALRSENVGDRPFAFRIPGRELIAFGPPARVDFTLPEQPPATSARIEAKVAGVRPKDSLRLVFAVGYPTGAGGRESAFRIQSQDVTAATQTGSFVADLGDQDPSRFPIHSALVHRLVQPWRLHGGAYTPEPALGKSTVALETKAGPAKLHARVVAPRYASHYDFLSFLGGANGKSAMNGLLRGAGSPNTTPPPADGSGGPREGGGPGPGLEDGGGGDGGTDGDGNGTPSVGSRFTPEGLGPPRNSNCGCGPSPGRGMPAPGCPSQQKCRGQCGQGCPANGHCRNDQGGTVNLEFPCPPSPKGCGQDKKTGECKCAKHPWSMNAAMEGIEQLFPGAADYAWFGDHSGWTSCDAKTEIGRLRVTYWAAAGFGQTHVWCTVFGTFGPCRKVQLLGAGPIEKPGDLGAPAGGPGSGPASGGRGPAGSLSSGSGTGSIVVVSSTPGAPLAASFQDVMIAHGALGTHPAGANDPNTMVHADLVATTLGIRGAVRTGFLQYDPMTLAGLGSSQGQTIAQVYNAANQSTIGATVANANTDLDLPLTLEALAEIIPALGGGGGGGGVPPGCGALGIEFLLGIGLVSALLRRLAR